jgi:hypothetical protein
MLYVLFDAGVAGLHTCVQRRAEGAAVVARLSGHTHGTAYSQLLCYFPLAGGEGGSVGVQQSFLAVLNSSLVGTPPAGQAAAAAAGGSSAGRDAIRSIIMSAYTGERQRLCLCCLHRGGVARGQYTLEGCVLLPTSPLNSSWRVGCAAVLLVFCVLVSSPHAAAGVTTCSCIT